MIMGKKQAYEQKIEAQLNEWKSEIGKLQAKADKAEAEARIEYHEQIAELNRKKDIFEDKLSALKKSGDESWDDLKKGLDETGEAIKKTFSNIKSNFS